MRSRCPSVGDLPSSVAEDHPRWVTVHARDAAAAASSAAHVHQGRVLRVVPLEEDRWQVQLDAVPTVPESTDDSQPGSPRRSWLIVGALAVGIVAVCVVVGVALNQRDTASEWRARARAAAAELDAQREATSRATDALARSEATVADLRDDVARLSAAAAAAGDDDAIASAGS